MTPPNSYSTNQFGKNTIQQLHQPFAVIDTQSQISREDLLDILVELKGILQDSIKALSVNQP